MVNLKQTMEVGNSPPALLPASGSSRNSHRPTIGRKCFLARLLLFFLLQAVVVAAAADSDEAAAIEYKVKAGFLFNFVKFVEWPEGAFPTTNAPIVIGLFETDPAAPILERALQQKTANGHPLQVLRCPAGQIPVNCHLFFLSRAEQAQTSNLLERFKGKPVLTVSESGDFARAGGMINLVMKGDSIRFEINLQAAERAGLQISSRLANMAILVKPPN